ncbi:ABC transporter substrate-binding protein [Paenibacillus sp. FSL R7-269]|uniref:ABC transporter substrate-binding protein n=1 Tax=Paenibacillus sp. FSL R7-269 TaxID=1226755 RepID=UPI0003E1F0CC|nr:ABC transporter substrate-binding protein [Paenibacillus sp. FSL R7-269]ETT50726.1 ABC transporter substrate-binding protein [Paenibacillus sp. FSL R7-269]
MRFNRSDSIRAWNHVPVRIMDIRHMSMRPGEQERYVFPSSVFVFTNQGEAVFLLDGTGGTAGQSQVMHGGKGAILQVASLGQPLDYYLILYKPWSGSAFTEARGDEPGSFQQRYAFPGSDPWVILSLLERMHQLWRSGGELERVQVLGLFYQFVAEQFRQLELAGEQEPETDLAEQIARYIGEFYHQPLSMSAMARLFHYSTHHLVRVFKRKYQCSPMEYVSRTRMQHAKSLLARTDAPIRDVAERVGYTDFYYFSRLFKKVYGETPAQFKMHAPLLEGSNPTKEMPESFIARRREARYIDIDDNHYQYRRRSVNDLKASLKPMFMMSLLISLSVMVAGCGGGNTKTADDETTKLFTDGFGREVEIPAEPSQVVALTYGGYMLPLGLKPAGVNQETLEQYKEEMADVENVDSGTGNVEAISALMPDLIIIPDYLGQDVIETYEKIAPTVAVAWGGDPDVVNTLRTMGEIMGKQEEAEKWIASFDKKLQGIRDSINVKLDEGTTAISFIIHNGEVLLGGEGGTLGKLIYQDFGFTMPEQFKEYADGGTALSMERLVDKPADYFFTQMTDEELDAMHELFKEPVYQSIPAVKNNRIINVSRANWNNGPYTVDRGVDALIEQVSKLQE